ncbi:MAG TPA: ligase-associated DNA damage response endonuclease PdeM [Rhizomicrobium sp.]|nr:ligase-associated DNA damage response endonuclease PdeM [Rhizomicrobium sp.]
MHETRIEVSGEELLLEVSGALWWPAENTLVFADLHFEKGSSYARGGQMLPPYDTRSTLARMETLVRRRHPARVIALGDSFHDTGAAERLDEQERARLAQLRNGAEWIWIAGNHDPAPPAWLGGHVTEEAAIGGLIFRHEPQSEDGRGEIAGHLHPCATVTRRGRALRRRCFVSDGVRLLMPAFGAYAGGLDVGDAAVRMLFRERFLTYLLGRARVYAVAG